MRRVIHVAFGALLCASLLSGPAAADLPQIQGDGWYTWQVDETGADIEMCCFTRDRSKNVRSGCDLDGRNRSFSGHGDCATEPGKLQIYAHVKNGKAIDIRALSSNCAVSSTSEIKDLGLVSAADNLTWFRVRIEDRSLDRQVREAALFALAMSESDAAYAYFDRLLSSR